MAVYDFAKAVVASRLEMISAYDRRSLDLFLARAAAAAAGPTARGTPTQ
jgi:hypothetical protein